MANITEILGTDSLSSSRLTINSNFMVINDEIADITSLIDPTTKVITDIISISAESLVLSTIIGQATTQILSIDATVADFNIASNFDAAVDLKKSVLLSGKLGAGGSGNGSQSTTPSFTSISTFFADASFDLPVGSDGQIVTIISTNSNGVVITPSISVDIGATSIELPDVNSSVTLKFFAGNTPTWYIIASHNATIS
jgi:hypothetical protein